MPRFCNSSQSLSVGLMAPYVYATACAHARYIDIANEQNPRQLLRPQVRDLHNETLMSSQVNLTSPQSRPRLLTPGGSS